MATLAQGDIPVDRTDESDGISSADDSPDETDVAKTSSPAEHMLWANSLHESDRQPWASLSPERFLVSSL